MKQIIIALSGRKNAGKNVVGQCVMDYFTSHGKSVQQFSFADAIKSFCIETLGLSYEQCYGTDEQKNSPTKYSWNNVTDIYLRWKFAGRKWTQPDREWSEIHSSRHNFWEYYQEGFGDFGFRCNVPVLMSGPMSGREIMQLFGTELVRETFGNVWADATIRKINNSGCDVAIITDNRFPNEIESVLSQPGGHVIRLTRSPFIEDGHASETSLDDFDWNTERCFVIDNAQMSIEDQNKAIVPVLQLIEEVL